MLKTTILIAVLAASTCSAELTLAQQSIVASQYAVASGHPLASHVGLEILKKGGNVIDAAIATSFALGVAEPYGSGLGGKIIMLYRDAATGKVYSIVGLCSAPAELNIDEFRKLTALQRYYSYQAVGVPGLVAGLDEAYRRWGSLPWKDLVLPAAKLAEEGVEIDATMRSLFLPKVKYLRRDEEASQLYLVDGKAPAVGTSMRNADLAESLRLIASNGAEAFYNGKIAERIVAAAHEHGSDLTLNDFKKYQVEVSEPLVTDYRGYTLYSCPPPLTGGITVLSALECLEQMGSQSEICNLVSFTDRLGRSLQCLYPTIRDTVADVPLARSSSEKLLALNESKRISNQAIHLNPSNPYQDGARLPAHEQSAESLPSASTSHLVVVDREGNMVSLTQSLSLHFGASVIAPETGILLNDSLSNFAIHNSKAVNHVGQSKRARSTIAPIIITEGEEAWLALGIPGGQRIPTTTLQLLWRLIDRQEHLGDAFEASRFHLRRPLSHDEAPNIIDHEADASENWVHEMTELGWKLEARPRNGHYFGGGNAIQYAKNGDLIGVADSRRTNFVAGD